MFVTIPPITNLTRTQLCSCRVGKSAAVPTLSALPIRTNKNGLQSLKSAARRIQADLYVFVFSLESDCPASTEVDSFILPGFSLINHTDFRSNGDTRSQGNSSLHVVGLSNGGRIESV